MFFICSTLDAIDGDKQKYKQNNHFTQFSICTCSTLRLPWFISLNGRRYMYLSYAKPTIHKSTIRVTSIYLTQPQIKAFFHSCLHFVPHPIIQCWNYLAFVPNFVLHYLGGGVGFFFSTKVEHLLRKCKCTLLKCVNGFVPDCRYITIEANVTVASGNFTKF